MNQPQGGMDPLERLRELGEGLNHFPQVARLVMVTQQIDLLGDEPSRRIDRVEIEKGQDPGLPCEAPQRRHFALKTLTGDGAGAALAFGYPLSSLLVLDVPNVFKGTTGNGFYRIANEGPLVPQPTPLYPLDHAGIVARPARHRRRMVHPGQAADPSTANGADGIGKWHDET